MEILGLIVVLAVIALIVFVVMSVVQLIEVLWSILVAAVALALAAVGHVYAVRYFYYELQAKGFAQRTALTVMAIAALSGLPIGIACRIYNNTLNSFSSENPSFIGVYVLLGLGILPVGSLLGYFLIQQRRLLRERDSYIGYIIRGDGW